IVVEAAITSGVMHTVRWALELGRDVLAVPGNITSRMSEGTNMLIAQGAHVITKVEDVFELLNIDYKVKKVEVELTDEEQSVLEVLTDEPQHVDDIAERLNMPVQRLTAILLTLELKRQVKQLPGRNFIRLP
ncbi:DNA-protecting protein DprA, partial [candidate division WOR-3 bacterium]|nr:DNA-protecting protein DprA [candidate division WOR-3 bacterium]